MTPPAGIADEVSAPITPRPPAGSAAADPVTAPRLLWPLVKRGIDICMAAALLTLTLPLLLLTALAIKLDSPGPVFHRVWRVGYRGRPFQMLKFRKMHAAAGGPPLTVATDPRLTRIGSLLTRTRLDELPQLWHVLAGHMSLIGPRPEDAAFVALHTAAYETILKVRPGITGITQLAFADERDILDPADPVGDYVRRIMPGKVRLDLLYASENGISLDLAVLYWTVRGVIMRRPVAVHRATGRMSVRRRPLIAAEDSAARSERATLRTPDAELAHSQAA